MSRIQRAQIIKAQQAAMDFVVLTDELLQAERGQEFYGSVRLDKVRRKGRKFRSIVNAIERDDPS